MPPERTATTYGPGITGASKTVLLELMATLRIYQDALVLIGGWVPYFLLEQSQRPNDQFIHVGSIDIDVAVDPLKINEPEYATIVELLKERGYAPAADKQGSAIPSSFERTVRSPATNKPYAIRVDFLTHVDGQSSIKSRHVSVQNDLFARKIKGCAAAFKYQTRFSLSGALPDGGEMTVPIRMADLVGCLTMKGIVLGERYREKDAYDIYALIAHYQHGPADVAETLRPHLSDGLVRESVESIQAAFAHRSANGPAWVAGFLVNPLFSAERERFITDAFMVVDEFQRLLRRPEPAARSSG